MIKFSVLFVMTMLIFAMIPPHLASVKVLPQIMPTISDFHGRKLISKLDPGEGAVAIGNGIFYANYTFRDSAGKIISDGNTICKNISTLNMTADHVVFRFDKNSYHAEESAELYAVLHYLNTGMSTKHFLCVHLTSPSNDQGIMILLKEKAADISLKNKNWHYYQSMGYAALSSILQQTEYVYGPNLLISQKDTLVKADLLLGNGIIRTQAKIDSEIPSVAGGRGETMAYNPSLLSSTTTRYVCTNDLDKDYVCDEWETGGPLQITINGATYVGPACGVGTNDPYCPSPNHRDILVQVDHITGFDLDPSFVSDVTAAFKSK